VPLLLDNGYSVGAPFYIGEGIFPSVPNFIPSQNIPPTPTATPQLAIDLDYGAGVNASSLRVGDTIPLKVTIRNTGNANINSPILLEMTVPKGLKPIEVSAENQTLNIANTVQDILNGLQTFFQWLLGSNNYPLQVSDATTQLGVTYEYQIGSLPANGAVTLTFDLKVLARQSGTFSVSATASAQSPAQAMSMLAFSASANSSGNSYSSSDVLMVQVQQEPPHVCISVNVGNTNLRSVPSTDNNTPILILGDGANLKFYIIGRLNSGEWFRVSGYILNEIITPYVGWISNIQFPDNGGEPCENGTPPKAQLPVFDSSGNPIATLTPTITLIPTITPTATAFVTPTLYPTSTPGSSVAPNNLCSDRSEQWIKDLCLQAWNYLDDTQRSNLITAINNNLSTNFIPLDAWWLQNIQRGIMDVPPKIWQYDSLQQCNGNTNCNNIITNTSIIFDNMWRTGVDLNSSSGTGQTIDGINFKEGFLPTTDIIQNSIWGHNVPSLACNYNRFGLIKPQFDSIADICWVCQDLTTELYKYNGINLENNMRQIGEFSFSNYPNRVSRYVPTVYRYLQLQGRVYSGSVIPYVIGDIAFLSDGNSSNQFQYFHSGIVVKGYNGTFEEALDRVLIAQMSFSSQGYFTNDGSFVDNTNFSSEQFIGRFEVITLRTYLYKNLLAQQQLVPFGISELQTLADTYLAHGRPIELGY
jgi:uncharacterized repeat protein (TIGR01451 family)